LTFAPLFLSFEVAALAVAIASVFGIAMAALLSRSRVPGRDLLGGLVMAPMVLPPTVLGYYVLVLFGRRSAIGGLFESLTGSSIVFTVTGAVLAAAIGALPLIVLSSRAAFESIDETLVFAARTLGAGKFRAFVTIELPLAAPGIVAGLLLGFARSLGDFGVTLMVAGDIPEKTQTASLAIYDAIQANREGEALATISVLTVVAVLVMVLVRKLTRPRSAL
jgi:molybdate transport system permease protein